MPTDPIAYPTHDIVGPAVDAAVAVTIRDMVLTHDRRLDSLDTWRSELHGALALMKVAFGTSIVSAVVSILAVALMLGGLQR